MRVAHIITRMIIGGAQENTLFNCLDLQQMFGDEVLLITGPTTGPEGRLLEQGGAEELRYKLLPSLRREINPIHDTNAYRALRRTIGEFQPDVVHTHSAKGGILGRAAAWSLKVPAIIHSVHGAPFHAYQSRLVRAFYRRCERWAARRCHAMISVADAMTDLMVSADVASESKFSTIYSGMDTAPFLAANQTRDSTRLELGFAEDDLVIGKIARLFHLKGHEYVVAAAKQVIQSCPQVKFLFVGDGILAEGLKQEIGRQGLTEHFHFTGLVPPARIPALVGAMDILVHTSMREGLARTLPQALLAGRPVVSFDIDGAREVCLDGETGYLIEAKDITGLSKALIRLSEEPRLREEYGSRGRELCRQRFDHHTMTRQIRELYQSVLGQAQ